MAGIQYFPVVVVFLYLAIFSKLRFAASKYSGLSIRLIPRDSPESPIYPGNLTQLEIVNRMIHFSNAEAELKQLRSTPNATFGDEKFLVALESSNYYLIGQFHIGKPSQFVYLAIDSGSPLIWTQCQPCINCFAQQNPIYDPRSSSTYQRIPCDHPRCDYNHNPYSIYRCENGDCKYDVYYGGGQIGPTTGFASVESFEFLTSDGDTVDYNIFFGCSNDNRNFRNFAFTGNKISGILGLNLSPESIFGQLSDIVGSVFSYCVAPYDQQYARPHILRFGEDVFIPQNVPTTYYFTFQGQYFYYLNCYDISVGAIRIGLPAGTFDAAIGSGFLIDSGAPLTRFTKNAINGINVFRTVLAVFRDYYDDYDFVRVPAAQNPTLFKLCYWQRQGFTDFASLTFHFQGADYTVDPRYVNVNFPERRFFCVAINGVDAQESLLGTYHMQNMRIIYNGYIDAIHFYPDDCTLDHL